MECSVLKESRSKGSDLNTRRVPVAVRVIIPVTERWDDLAQIYWAHAGILNRHGYSFEFVFVIDGGLAGPAKTLEPLVVEGEPIRILTLPRQFGEATALMVGFEGADSDIILTLPAYFQTLPEGLEKVLANLEEGYDLVVTRRYPRLDPFVNRLQNKLFHFAIKWLTGLKFNDMSCGLRGFRKRVIQELQLYGDLHRFFPLLAFQRGFRVIELPVPQHEADCRPRIHRPGIYLRRILDILTVVFLFKFTKKPLRFFGLVGTALFSSGFFLSLVLAAQKLFWHAELANRPLLLLGVLLMVLGIQTGSIGFLGEMIIFTHARKRPEYKIGSIL